MISRVYEHVEENYASKNDASDFQNKIESQFDEQLLELKGQKQMIDLLGKQLQAMITTEVRRATAHLRGSALEDEAAGPDGVPPGIELAPDTLRAHFDKKLDRNELESFLKDKSSKAETEMALRQIDILHKQVKQLALLLTQKLRFSLEKAGESNNNKRNKKVNLLHQALLISNWSNNFSTHGINDCFDNSQNRVPSDLGSFEKQLHSDLKNFNKVQLSPNNEALNDFVKNQSLHVFGGLKDRKNKALRNAMMSSTSSKARPNFLTDAPPSNTPAPQKYSP